MSEVEKTTEETSAQSVEKATTTDNEITSKLKSAKEKAESELAEMKSRLEAIEQEKMEAQGDFKKLLEKEREKNKSLSEKQKHATKTFAEKFVKAQFNQHAAKLGCVDSDLAFKACDLSDLDLDADFSFDEKSLTAKLEAVAKEKPYLFKKDVAAPRDTLPTNRGPDAKAVSAMKTDEIWAAIAKLK